MRMTRFRESLWRTCRVLLTCRDQTHADDDEDGDGDEDDDGEDDEDDGHSARCAVTLHPH